MRIQNIYNILLPTFLQNIKNEIKIINEDKIVGIKSAFPIHLKRNGRQEYSILTHFIVE